jgi:pimeloyl-ACP methyl ester carboxylesterase
MSRTLVALAALAALAVLVAPAGRALAQDRTTEPVALEPFTLEVFDGRKAEVELGHLTVPETRGAATGRTVRLAFVRLRARAAHPGPPIVFLAGGPGVPATIMGRIPPYYDLFDKLRDVADVVLLDQRGCGMSEPALDCPADAATPADVLASEERARSYVVSRASACLDAWRAKGVDVAAYTTDASADDLDDLRHALGAERLSLLALSYGTELGLAYLRRHGDTVGRVVLAATRGPDEALLLPSTLDLQLKKLSRLVAADPTMGKLVPDLEGLLRRVLDEADAKPLVVTVKDRHSGAPAEVHVGRFALRALVQGDLGDARAFARLPLLLYTVSRGDLSLLTPRIEGMLNGIGSASAMNIGMNCSYGSPASRLERVRVEAATSVLGDVMNFSWPEICETVVHRDARRAATPPLWCTAPTLFLSGTLDSTTPPQQAEAIRWGFPNAAHIVVENAGHETLPLDEVQTVVLDFFKGDDVSGRAVRLPPPRFVGPEEKTGRE